MTDPHLTSDATSDLTAAEARELAREAAVFFFPMVEMYKTMHAQAVDVDGPHFKAAFNGVGHATGVFTPSDSDFVTPNSDTPYSFAWLDLRAEPCVITLPPVEPDRYLSVQVMDLYTHIAGYLGTRTTGNFGGRFLVAGPDWAGGISAEVDAVVRVESELALALFRTQMFSEADLTAVRDVQSGFKVEPLSAFARTPAPPAPTRLTFPPVAADMSETATMFRYVNFLTRFTPVHADDRALLARVRRLGIGPGIAFDERSLPADIRTAVDAGIADARAQYLDLAHNELLSEPLSSTALFGTREHLAGRHLHRYAGAAIGIFGNAGEEAVYVAEFTDSDGNALDASKHRYRLRLTDENTPPALAFWSITMYDARTKLLVDNPLRRYLISSRTARRLRRDPDGAHTLHLQRDQPGTEDEANWLPAPDGPFYLIIRIFVPDPRLAAGEWTRPRVEALPGAVDGSTDRLDVEGDEL